VTIGVTEPVRFKVAAETAETAKRLIAITTNNFFIIPPKLFYCHKAARFLEDLKKRKKTRLGEPTFSTAAQLFSSKLFCAIIGRCGKHVKQNKEIFVKKQLY
jgi:hypothetical protein